MRRTSAFHVSKPRCREVEEELTACVSFLPHVMGLYWNDQTLLVPLK